MPSRRQVLGAMITPLAAPLVAHLVSGGHRTGAAAAARELRPPSGPPEAAARDEDFWFQVGQAFPIDRSIINLNNAGVCPSPLCVHEALKRHLDYSNQAPPYTMWRVLEPQREAVRQQLARSFGCDAEEVAVTRGASESLEICQLGIDLERGDEVLTTDQDYPRMLTTFEQRQRREGIVLKKIALPMPAEDEAAVVRLFEEAITPRTRLILVCHMINLTGQILPVRAIVAMARRHGIPVIVDGAHTLAHLDFRIDDLDCDSYASSLHKWLCAPHGTGLLYVRREKIGALWPLMAADAKLGQDIRKFEEIGTHPAANFLAVAEAVTFHDGIGAARKHARLVHLRDTWAKRLLQSPRVRLHTSLKPGFAGGTATVQVEGLESAKLVEWLWEEHHILTTAIKHERLEGVRVSPGVYTTPQELDRFCSAVEQAMREGIGGE